MTTQQLTFCNSGMIFMMNVFSLCTLSTPGPQELTATATTTLPLCPQSTMLTTMTIDLLQLITHQLPPTCSQCKTTHTARLFCLLTCPASFPYGSPITMLHLLTMPIKTNAHSAPQHTCVKTVPQSPNLSLYQWGVFWLLIATPRTWWRMWIDATILDKPAYGTSNSAALAMPK